ncbi:MAG: hypothetical protein QXT63_04585, partial [Thermoplasmata archaeon]
MNIPKIPDGRVVKVVNGGKYALRDLVDWLKKSEFNGYITQRLGKSESKMYLRKGEPAYVFNTSFNDGGTSFVQMLEDSTLPDTTIEVHALTKEQVQDADRILANSEESKVDPLYLNYDIDLVRLKISELEKVALRQQKSAVPESKMPTPSCEIKDETIIEERKGEKDVSKEKGENIGKKVNYSSKNGKKVRVRVVKNTVKNDERKEDKEDDKEVEAEIKIIENAKNE